tara:strand:+ start:11954 stop:12409 length:456 start_codon:yes stop_codon:yes gene_type:complete
MIKKVSINIPRENETNPRYINKQNFKKLVNSLKEFPEMLEVRPLIVDEGFVVLGGNMRLKALKEAKFEEIYIHQIKNWTQEQKDQFIIKDNSSFGSWDWEILANEWNTEKLVDWGIEMPKELFAEEIDPAKENEDADIPKEICPTCGAKLK